MGLFCEQLRKDTELLRKLKIMDYSLLVGIHYSNRKRAASMLSDSEHDDNEEQKTNTQKSTTTKQARQKKKPEKPMGIKISTSNDNDVDGDDDMNNDIHLTPSTTSLHEAPKHLFSDCSDDSNKDNDDDEEKKENKSPASKLKVGHKRNGSQSLRPGLNRVTSRRISQISPNHQGYTVKTPIAEHFDMPELVDMKRMQRMSGIEEEDEDEYTNIFAADKGGMQMIYDDGKEGECIFFCGIIDVLQKYNKRKKVENFLRGLNNDTQTISAVPPDQYAKRMYDFLRQRIR